MEAEEDRISPKERGQEGWRQWDSEGRRHGAQGLERTGSRGVGESRPGASMADRRPGRGQATVRLCPGSYREP